MVGRRRQLAPEDAECPWRQLGELFALRWRDLDEQDRTLAVREAVYEGRFDTPKTEAGVRQMPLSDVALKLAADWRARIKEIDPDALVFSTWSGKPISPNSVLRRQVFPACEAMGLKHVTLVDAQTHLVVVGAREKVYLAKSWRS